MCEVHKLMCRHRRRRRRKSGYMRHTKCMDSFSSFLFLAIKQRNNNIVCHVCVYYYHRQRAITIKVKKKKRAHCFSFYLFRSKIFSRSI